MQKLVSLFFKGLRRIFLAITGGFEWLYCRFLFYAQNVQCKSFVTKGIPYVSVALGGRCIIGNGLAMNNGLKGNPIGRPQRCVFFVDSNAEILIGNNVGMSAAAIVAHTSITIGNNVKIGGGVCIYDTDFHALDAEKRAMKDTDKAQANKQPVVIEDNVFIGAHSTILKGVTIGQNAIIGACSVVTRSVPSNEIWGGNPAKFIKALP
ncbi:MAG: acyltransferase [Terrimonas sp.]|nr:acyltransferase [Terrimonas sp.]OJY93977.1 MAG: transferase [Sphingobacteriales bacterium 40-81]